MRVALCADGRSPHSQRWANGVADRGHEVAFVWIREELDSSYFSSFRPSISHHSYVPPAPRGRPWMVPFALLAPRRLVRQLEPDLVHGLSLSGHGWAAHAFGVHPLVLTALGSDVFQLRRSAGGSIAQRAADAYGVWLTRAAVAAADLVLADSATLADQIRQRVPGTATRIVRFGVELSPPAPSARSRWRQRLGIDDDAFVILSSRLVRPHYNIDTIIHALPAIRRRLPHAVLVLKELPRFSDPAYLRFCLELADELGVREVLRTVGELDREELLELTAAADLYVSIPATDGTAVSVLEAMAAGVAIVATDAPGIDPAILRGDETALLVPTRNPESLAAAVVALGLDADLRLSIVD
ncbi:MAG: glycosyltransferase, partial [Actinomycetota bacterium]|nr:glycosyltransferase [Actinomycetota bacterium]